MEPPLSTPSQSRQIDILAAFSPATRPVISIWAWGAGQRCTLLKERYAR